MPPELRKAHQDNDRAVMEAYGFPVKGTTESDCVAKLMKIYLKLSGEGWRGEKSLVSKTKDWLDSIARMWYNKCV